MKPIKYIRHKAIITEVDSKESVVNTVNFKSINKAKKESRLLQLSEDGGLGLGSLQLKK